MDIAWFHVNRYHRLMRFLPLGVGIAGDYLDRVNDPLELRVFHLARRDLAIYRDRAFLFVHLDAARRLFVLPASDEAKS